MNTLNAGIYLSVAHFFFMFVMFFHLKTSSGLFHPQKKKSNKGTFLRLFEPPPLFVVGISRDASCHNGLNLMVKDFAKHE